MLFRSIPAKKGIAKVPVIPTRYYYFCLRINITAHMDWMIVLSFESNFIPISIVHEYLPSQYQGESSGPESDKITDENL